MRNRRHIIFQKVNIIKFGELGYGSGFDGFETEIHLCDECLKASNGVLNNEIIEEGRVLVNNINELKFSKKINVGDVITIRGKGKFIYDGEENKTRSDRIVVNIRKYK